MPVTTPFDEDGALWPRKQTIALAQQLDDEYTRVLQEVRAAERALDAEIAARRAAGEPITDDWLLKNARYRTLAAQLEREIADLGPVLSARTQAEARDAVEEAIAVAQDLTRIGLAADAGDPATAVNNLWVRVPTAEIESVIQHPLGKSAVQTLYTRLGSQAGINLQTQLTRALVLGWDPATTARAIQQALGFVQSKALTIARSELLRAYRTATLESYKANSSLVTGWIWHADLSGRTCIACIAMNGTRHPLTEQLVGHPNCRCAMVPDTVSWASIDPSLSSLDGDKPTVPDGDASWAALTTDEQLASLPQQYVNRIASGELSVSDFVQMHDIPGYGPVYLPKPLSQIGG